MYTLACMYAGERAERPLLVTVYEHAGWYLSYLFDDLNAGTVVGSANDCAIFHGRAKQARVRYQGVQMVNLGTIRRGKPALCPHGHNPDEGLCLACAKLEPACEACDERLA